MDAEQEKKNSKPSDNFDDRAEDLLSSDAAQAYRIEDMAAQHLDKELEILTESELKEAVCKQHAYSVSKRVSA